VNLSARWIAAAGSLHIYRGALMTTALGHGSPVLLVEPGVSCFAHVLYSCHGSAATCPAVLCHLVWARRGCQVATGGRASAAGRCDSVTRQEEARQLLTRLGELARDETLSEQDATEIVAGLVGALERMRENPAWQRVMAKAGPRSSRWPRWVAAWHSPPRDPDTPGPEMQLTRALASTRSRGQSPTGSPTDQWREGGGGRAGSPAGLMAVFCNAAPRLPVGLVPARA